MTLTAFHRSQMLWPLISVVVCDDLAHAEGRPSPRPRIEMITHPCSAGTKRKTSRRQQRCPRENVGA